MNPVAQAGAPWGAALLVGCLLAASTGTPASADPCRVGSEHGGLTFPVWRLEAEAGCRLGSVIDEYTTVGLIGPVRAPIAPDAYAFLLDRPLLLAALIRHAGLGRYRVTSKGPDRYWVDDGEGTQGLFTLLYRDASRRIYHMDGFHEGRIFPLVRAQAAILVAIEPAGPVNPGDPGAAVTLVSYTRLNDPILAGLVRALRPLIGGAVTRKITHAFAVTAQLADIMAADPPRFLSDATQLVEAQPQDLARLRALTASLGGATSGSRPASAH